MPINRIYNHSEQLVTGFCSSIYGGDGKGWFTVTAVTFTVIHNRMKDNMLDYGDSSDSKNHEK